MTTVLATGARRVAALQTRLRVAELLPQGPPRALTMAATNPKTARFLADPCPPLCSLNIKPAFDLLSEHEKAYAHWIGKASWAGGKIIADQVSQQGVKLYDLLIAIFGNSDRKTIGDLATLKSAAAVPDDQWNLVLEYSAQVLSNLGNYRSFGHSKFIPRADRAAFEKVVDASVNAAFARPIWNELADHIYALEPEAACLIGDPNKGHISNYYLGEQLTTAEEVALVQKAAEELKVKVLNTRVRKLSSNSFELLIASVNKSTTTHKLTIDGTELELSLVYGDYSTELAKANEFLAKAIPVAANDHQRAMLKDYIKSFETGSVEAHEDASRHWVKDVGPVVESYIGFIETYTDPFGGRAEWEGFTAIVNKELSAKYEKLVDGAPELIKVLPWGKEYEVDVFRRPDFTALEIVSFATPDIPAGINIPNYYEIREQDGFKNVSLANILAAKPANEPVTFIRDEDLELYNKYDSIAFELQVANHELLGHGTGKLFQEDAQGKLNFDPAKTINPLTGKPVSTWYKPGQTAGSVLGSCSSSLEECRAETVAMYLANSAEIMGIFGYTDPQLQSDLHYVTFLIMARAGIRGLEFWDPAARKHQQAHMQARMGITLFMIKEKLASLEEVRDDKGVLTDLFIKVDRDAVHKHGTEVMGKLLVQLQVPKSIADGAGARSFYESLTTPPKVWDEEIRDFVMSKRLPRRKFVQPNTIFQDDKVVLKDYPLTFEGLIQSCIEREL
ncbi:dipeptidyl-peptidase III [Auriculariales sp. MPI-PUGE-AT-0066]|nr:dipeptidyl-peptidase III [Auriculariales sp. MPI-PUGE-AT-0066]